MKKITIFLFFHIVNIHTVAIAADYLCAKNIKTNTEIKCEAKGKVDFSCNNGQIKGLALCSVQDATYYLSSDSSLNRYCLCKIVYPFVIEKLALAHYHGGSCSGANELSNINCHNCCAETCAKNDYAHYINSDGEFYHNNKNIIQYLLSQSDKSFVFN